MGNVDPDPDPGVRKLTKINKSTSFTAFQKDIVPIAGVLFDLSPTLSIFFMKNFPTFCDFIGNRIRIRSRTDPHWFGFLDQIRI
jgi:hypothetical protein